VLWRPQQYLINYRKLTPIVYTNVVDYGVQLTNPLPDRALHSAAAPSTRSGRHPHRVRRGPGHRPGVPLPRGGFKYTDEGKPALRAPSAAPYAAGLPPADE